MNKKELLEGHNKEEQILISKMMDKMEEAKQKNKITNTDFLDGYQIRICTEILNKAKFNNYIFFGGYEEAERKIIVFYPDKFKFIIEDKKLCQEICKRENPCFFPKIQYNKKMDWRMRDGIECET